MARLNILKMIGLVVLLLVALALPSVLPKVNIISHDQSLVSKNTPQLSI